MPSTLSRSYSVPVSFVPTQPTRSKDVAASTMNHQIDPKAVGAHRPLSRRRSNPPGSPDSDEGSLFGADSLSSLSSLLTNQLQQHNNHSTLMMQLHRSGHRKLDRSHSEPVVDRSAQLAQQQQQINQQQQSNSSRYKTELCRPYEENGTCKYGDKCQFAHGFHELRSLIRHPKYKTELCRTFHTIGFCPYGPRCHFVHNAEEARNNSPPPPATKNNNSNNNQHAHRGKFTLPAGVVGMGGNGSTADSPSPPSSLSESPTSMSTFFSDDMYPGNPFSPMGPSSSSSSSGLGNASAFLFGSTDFGLPLFSSGKANSYSSAFNNNNNSSTNNNNLKRSVTSTGKNFIPELDSPSPVGSLASDLDSLSLGSTSCSSSSNGGTSPPPSISSPMDTSRALRLPIFSRISETLNED
ncbi:mRNA decay activator protein ZFP36L1-like isoform X1 [Daphnia pulicaria]|nr:mRNA decay activator protein ZFP36L1-like isoform X1 [Daphnia pulicaria]